VESKIERKACSLILERYGIQSAKFTSPGMNGFPDRIYFVPGGKPVFIEFKEPGELPRPLQAFRIQWLRSIGYLVYWTDSVEGACEIIEDALRTEPKMWKGICR